MMRICRLSFELPDPHAALFLAILALIEEMNQKTIVLQS